MKLLRRKVFLRKVDFDRHLRVNALSCGYDRAEWTPISISDVCKELTFMALSGKQVYDSLFFSSREINLATTFTEVNWIHRDDKELFARYYIEYLRRHNMFYQQSFKNWAWKFDDDYVYIRYRKDLPWHQLGVAVLERDYGQRI